MFWLHAGDIPSTREITKTTDPETSGSNPNPKMLVDLCLSYHKDPWGGKEEGRTTLYLLK